MSTSEVAESWESIPVNTFVDAGEHGLFLKLTEDGFVPVKIHKGNVIGYGTSIHASEFPEVTLQRLESHEIATIPESHALPTLRNELTGAVGSLVNKLLQRAYNCFKRKTS